MTATVKGKSLTEIGSSLTYVPSPSFDLSNGASSSYDDFVNGEKLGAFTGCAAGDFFPIVGCILSGGVGSQVLGAIGAVYGWSEGRSDSPYADPFNTGQPDTGEDPLEYFKL